MFVNRCDCCCLCGQFCSNTPYCGVSLQLVATFSGATDGSPNACNCSSLNATFPDFFNQGLLGTDLAAGYTNAQSVEATGNSCFWIDGSFTSTLQFCDDFDGIGQTWAASRSFATGMVYTYKGVDAKWRMVYDGSYTSTYETYDYATMTLLTTNTYACDLGGEVLFDGGGAPMDCGTVGELTPTFSLTIAISRYNETGVSGNVCNPPTSVLLEGNPT